MVQLMLLMKTTRTVMLATRRRRNRNRRRRRRENQVLVMLILFMVILMTMKTFMMMMMVLIYISKVLYRRRYKHCFGFCCDLDVRSWHLGENALPIRFNVSWKLTSGFGINIDHNHPHYYFAVLTRYPSVDLVIAFNVCFSSLSFNSSGKFGRLMDCAVDVLLVQQTLPLTLNHGAIWQSHVIKLLPLKFGFLLCLLTNQEGLFGW